MTHEENITVTIETNKKQLGAFYTPKALTDVICEWAITSIGQRVLEPSFGGCGFLRSAAERFSALGSKDPQRYLYGCDIDPKAFEHLSNTFSELVDLSHYKMCNFLELCGKQAWGIEFDCIIGNPPYLPYRYIDESARDSAIVQLEKLGICLDLRSSLWAYFVALGLNYLKFGGRIAWVLPGSFLQANYASELREILAQSFEHIHAFLIRERLFLYEGTEEQTVVLLGTGYRCERSIDQVADISLSICKNVDELQHVITRWEANELSTDALCGRSVADFLNSDARDILNFLEALPICHRLGNYADVRVGLVTGDNKFFVLDRKSIKQNELNENQLIPILSKFIFSPGLSFKPEDHREIAKQGGRCFLVNVHDPKQAEKSIENYLDQFPEDKIATLSTFKKRKIWSHPDDSRLPDAFLPVMHHWGPRLVLNDARINCTNTLHRVYFKKKPNKSFQKLLALSMISSYSQISAEIVGRKYGAGILKHEPREAEKIHLLVPQNIHWNSIGKTYRQVDELCRSKRFKKARNVVDEFLLKPILKEKYLEFLLSLDECLTDIRINRHHSRNGDSSSSNDHSILH